MNATKEETKTIGCWLSSWGEINPEQHKSHISFDPEPTSYTPWSFYPKQLTVPAGWHTAESRQGTVELYDETGNHVSVVQIGNHRKSIQVATADGTRWIAMGDSEAGPCCPLCGK